MFVYSSNIYKASTPLDADSGEECFKQTIRCFPLHVSSSRALVSCVSDGCFEFNKKWRLLHKSKHFKQNEHNYVHTVTYTYTRIDAFHTKNTDCIQFFLIITIKLSIIYTFSCFKQSLCCPTHEISIRFLY